MTPLGRGEFTFSPDPVVERVSRWAIVSLIASGAALVMSLVGGIAFGIFYLCFGG